MAQPEIAILVSSYERPGHLQRVLASIAAQRDVVGALEVVVTDDGSRDETPRMVERFAASVNFPVRFTTHPHDGFQLARSRNEGVAASTAPYLLFLDGDCVIPPDHVRIHLDRRRRGFAMAGYYIHLNQAISQQVTEEEVRLSWFEHRVPLSKRLKMRWRHVRAMFYVALRDPTRPKLLGGNLGIARADYERVNGYDENFRGWGCEDDDLRLRLRAAGIGVASIAWWTHAYHLWHPKTPSAPATWRAGDNVDYYRRPLRLTRCLAGLAKRRLDDLHLRIIGRTPSREILEPLLPAWSRAALASDRQRLEPPEMEIAFGGGGGSFSERSDCRVLIVPRGQAASRELARRADLIFADHDVPGAAAGQSFSLAAIDGVIQRKLMFRKSTRSLPLPVATPALVSAVG
jgi:glycosyltransferase involved in cell wall biosynthesis